MMHMVSEHLVKLELELEKREEELRNELAHAMRVASLGELAATLAHELNQPLTAILSNAQAAQRFLADDQPDLSELRDILCDIVAQDKRAGEVIRRLRLLARRLADSWDSDHEVSEAAREKARAAVYGALALYFDREPSSALGDDFPKLAARVFDLIKIGRAHV